jgi:SAM-dependent methyltransferase
MSRGPERSAALAQYRRRAPVYDLELALFEPLRTRAVEALALRPGAVVLDLGCGTGLSFAPLLQAVGSRGRVVGVEQCAEMLVQAAERVRRHGWQSQVVLQQASAEAAPLVQAADAALFHFTHDILRDRKAVAHVLAHLRRGARVVACGLQWAPLWAWPANLFVLGAALHSVSTLEGLAQPWEHLAAALTGFAVHPALGGAAYLASGTVP